MPKIPVYVVKQGGRRLAEHPDFTGAERDRQNYCKRHQLDSRMVKVVKVEPAFQHNLSACPKAKRYNQGTVLQSRRFNGRQ